MKLTVSLCLILFVALSLTCVTPALGSGLLEIVYQNGAYGPADSVSPTTAYLGVAYNSQASNTNVYFATRADGGVDEVHYSGGWVADPYPLGGVVYNDVAYNSQSSNVDNYLATRADGGFEEIIYDGSTFVGNGANNTGVNYTGVAYNSRVANTDTYLATRADGGVDEIVYDGGWSETNYALEGTVFTDIAYNSQENNTDQYMGTLAAGGVQEIYYNGSEFVKGDLVNPGVVYNGVAYNSVASNVNVFLASCADGGVDEIYYNGIWNVDHYALSGYSIGDLTYNGRQGITDFYFGTVNSVPEPSTWAIMAVGLVALPWLRRRGR